MAVHHFSSVQVGETLSNLRNRSLEFFFDPRNDCLSRRLTIIVRLEDIVRIRGSDTVYVTCNTDGGNVSVRMGTEETQEIAFHKMQMNSHLTHIKLSTMSSTTPSPMPKTIAMWFFFSFVSSAISPSPGFFVARVVKVASMRWGVMGDQGRKRK